MTELEKATERDPNNISPRTLGILYCGDLGTAISRTLSSDQLRVITTCENRSLRTRRNAASVTIETLDSLDDVVRESDILFSLVSPEAAIATAKDILARQHLARPQSIYVDANSIGSQQFGQLVELFANAPISLVDATIHGGAKRLQEMGVCYLNGEKSSEVQALLSPVLRTVQISGPPGAASRMKQSIAGFSKGLNALFLEIALAAANAGTLDTFLHEFREFYPGIMEAIERMLPTYPEHVRRRIVELSNVEQFAIQNSTDHGMIHAARTLFERHAVQFESYQQRQSDHSECEPARSGEQVPSDDSGSLASIQAIVEYLSQSNPQAKFQ